MDSERNLGGEETDERKLHSPSFTYSNLASSTGERADIYSQTKVVSPAVLLACRAAYLVKGPVAARAALKK